MLDEPLVKITNTASLLVEPIWENPIDDIEGPLYKEYILNNPSYDGVYLRQSVAELLYQAAKNLPKNQRLIIRAGHRPQEVQLKLLNMVKDKFLSKNPDADDGKALAFARTYVSDPRIKLPPHCCGAAVDVDVLDTSNDRLVDFGCPVNTDSDIAFLNSLKITESQRANRQMLVRAMTSAGFAAFDNEWWHFSYGDASWAEYYKKNITPYKIIEKE